MAVTAALASPEMSAILTGRGRRWGPKTGNHD